MPTIKFGRLTFVRKAGVNRHRKILWECECRCGTTVTVVASSLRSGNTTSCGCWAKEVHRTHGMSRSNVGRATSEYKSWATMLTRCTNPRTKGYENYGGRGIKVCEKWRSFESFLSDMGLKPTPKHSIDRIDNDGDYKPSNCRWATKLQQDRNRRTNRNIEYNGQVKCITEWANLFNLHPMTLTYRLDSGWEIGKALTTPTRR